MLRRPREVGALPAPRHCWADKGALEQTGLGAEGRTPGACCPPHGYHRSRRGLPCRSSALGAHGWRGGGVGHDTRSADDPAPSEHGEPLRSGHDTLPSPQEAFGLSARCRMADGPGRARRAVCQPREETRRRGDKFTGSVNTCRVRVTSQRCSQGPAEACSAAWPGAPWAGQRAQQPAGRGQSWGPAPLLQGAEKDPDPASTEQKQGPRGTRPPPPPASGLPSPLLPTRFLQNRVSSGFSGPFSGDPVVSAILSCHPDVKSHRKPKCRPEAPPSPASPESSAHGGPASLGSRREERTGQKQRRAKSPSLGPTAPLQR